MKRKTVSKKVIMTVILVIFTFTMLFPLLWMISSSLKPEVDVFNFPIEWIPRRWSAIENYGEIWKGNYNFPLYYWNTFKISAIVTISQLLIASMGAFAFAKLNFPMKNFWFTLFLGTMMIPDQVTIIPKFILMRELHLIDTHLGLILLQVFSVYGVFLLKQNMMSIPDVIIEAAKIDGASTFRIFWQIAVPMSQPALVTLGILRFIWTWNDYQNALIFLNSRDLYTIQLGMSQFASQSGTFYSLLMAASVCAILPLLILFIIGQNTIIEGIASGSVKG